MKNSLQIEYTEPNKKVALSDIDVIGHEIKCKLGIRHRDNTIIAWLYSKGTSSGKSQKTAESHWCCKQINEGKIFHCKKPSTYQGMCEGQRHFTEIHKKTSNFDAFFPPTCHFYETKVTGGEKDYLSFKKKLASF